LNIFLEQNFNTTKCKLQNKFNDWWKTNLL